MSDHNHNIDITERFEFTSKEKMVLIGMMALGLICLVATYFMGGKDGELRFWTNFLHNSVFFTGIAFISMFLLAAKVLAYSGWHTVWKRLLEAKAQFLIFGLIFMGVILLGTKLEWHHLYHWAFPGITDPANKDCYDPIIAGKSGFLNTGFYALATFGFGLIWYLCVVLFRRLSLSEDKNGDESYSHHKKMKIVSAFFMPFGGFTSAALIWLWIMSIDSHWYSTMFAWYATASWLVSAVALLILTIIYLKSRGYFSYVSGEHLHDLGKYLFGFSVFWTYLWFSQFMLIWYANIGEETIYFDGRMTNYPVLFWGNLIMNFVLPLLILLRNDTKRKYGTLVLVCCITLFGHWVDFFQMIKPGALHTEHEYHEYACATHDHHDTKNDHGHHDHDDAKDGHHDKKGDDKHEHDTKSYEGHDKSHNSDGGHGEKQGSVGGDHGHHGHKFQMGFDIPGLLELGTFIGFLGLFFFVVFSSLAKAPLVPPNDPYLGESLHHHVGYGGGNMEGDHDHH